MAKTGKPKELSLGMRGEGVQWLRRSLAAGRIPEAVGREEEWLRERGTQSRLGLAERRANAAGAGPARPRRRHPRRRGHTARW